MSGQRVNQFEPRALPKAWHDVTHRIIGAAIEVHSILGPGLLEKMYEDALCVELQRAELSLQRQMPIRMNYKGTSIGDLRLDLVVNELVVVEIKAIDRVLDVHGAQLLSYLRCCELPLGLLINFNTPKLVEGVTRRLNPHSPLAQCLPLLSSECSPSSEFLPGGSP